MKKHLALALAILLAFSLGACSSSTDQGDTGSDGAETSESITIKVGATPQPHAEILEQVVDELAAQGITLEIVVYNDYVQPNVAVQDGSLDANYFQHQPYLDQFNSENGSTLVSVAKIHYEPLGLYPGKDKAVTVAAFPDGGTIAVPNDATNEARALQLLQAQGLIKLKEGVGLNATILDIEENPKNITITEAEAATLPRALEDVDAAVINGNYAIEAGLNAATDAIASEDAQSEAAQTFANLLVVKEGNESKPGIQELVTALTSPTVRDFINTSYSGAVVPIF